MNHPTEEQLILHYYGEDAEVAVGEHLSECEACRSEYRTLQRILNTVETMPVPERAAEYGTEVWQRIRPRLNASAATRAGWRRWFEWNRLALAAGMASVILLAFIAGRYARIDTPEPQVATNAPVRERILLVAVGDHLERSQMVLAELVNSGRAGEGQVDISFEQESAEDLLQSNRLFRMAATRNGDTATAAVLEELERTLLEIAHSPAEVSSAEFGELRQEIEDKGILFKVRVYASKVRGDNLNTVTN